MVDINENALYMLKQEFLVMKRKHEMKDSIELESLIISIREREEMKEQIDALQALKVMAAKYGYDISKPASNAKEAVQWLYFGYLGAIKDQNGAAMSIGRTSTFLDIYFEKDLAD